MRATLIQPPLIWPFGPYLSVPALAAYLRRQGHEVLTIDANLDVYDRLFSRSGLRELCDRLGERFRWLDRRPRLAWPEQEEYLRLVEGARTRLPAYLDGVEDVKQAFRSLDGYRLGPDGTLPLEAAWHAYMELKHLILPDYPNRLGLPALPLDRLYRSIDGSEPLSYDHILEETARRVAAAAPGVIGLSFTFSEQVLGGLTLAHRLRRHCPDVHIVVGGSYFSALRDGLDDILPRLPFVDSVVLDEGEGPLSALMEAVGRGADLDKVPGLVRVAGGRVRYSEPPGPMPVDDLPCPDFNGLELDRYFAAEPVLPYATARGCYHGRCAFCNFSLASRRFRARSPELVARDLEAIGRRHGRLFYFVQECEPPARMHRVAEAFIDRGLDINYQLFARFESDFDQALADRLAASGCLYIFFGLEAGSDRVNRLMRKGIDLRDAPRIVGCCVQAGLNVVVSSIRGFPGETASEYGDTVRFYQEVRRRFAHRARITGGTHLFRLNRGSDIDRHPERYGVAPGYRHGAGELATVYRSYRVGDDDGTGLYRLRQKWLEESPEILYNEILVLIATALAGGDSAGLVTARPRSVDRDGDGASWGRPGADAPLRPRMRLRLAPGSIVTACRFPVVELQRRGRAWRRQAGELFIAGGRSLAEVCAHLAGESSDLEPQPSLVLFHPACSGMVAVSARLRPVIELLRQGTTLEGLTALVAGETGPGETTAGDATTTDGGAVGEMRRSLETFVSELRRRGLVEARTPAGGDWLESSRGAI